MKHKLSKSSHHQLNNTHNFMELTFSPSFSSLFSPSAAVAPAPLPRNLKNSSSSTSNISQYCQSNHDPNHPPPNHNPITTKIDVVIAQLSRSDWLSRRLIDLTAKNQKFNTKEAKIFDIKTGNKQEKKDEDKHTHFYHPTRRKRKQLLLFHKAALQLQSLEILKKHDSRRQHSVKFKWSTTIVIKPKTISPISPNTLRKFRVSIEEKK